MDAQRAFAHFVGHVLAPEKAERSISLSAIKKGQRQILAGLCHQFGADLRPPAVRPGGYEALWDRPRFVFNELVGFGVEVASVREAYERLSIEDGLLILLSDASAGIHRPEAKWDDEKLLVAMRCSEPGHRALVATVASRGPGR